MSKFSSKLALLMTSIGFFTATPIWAGNTPQLTSTWGKQNQALLNAVETLAGNPSKADQARLAVDGGKAGAKLGASIGEAFVGWAVGEEYGLAGKLMGGLLGANVGSTGGASIGANVEQEHNFLLKDQELLNKIVEQLEQLQSLGGTNDNYLNGISQLSEEAQNELDAINTVIPNFYVPSVMTDVRQQIPVLLNNAEVLVVDTDQLTKKLQKR